MSHRPRIFIEAPGQTGQRIELPTERAHHLGRVLRRAVGDEVTLCDGQDCEYRARIIELDSRRCIVEVMDATRINRESPLQIHVVQGIARGDRMDFVIQKAVELGASAITPVFTAQCGVRLKGGRLENKWRHWQAVAQAAAEQSHRTRLPAVHRPAAFEHWLAQHAGAGLVLAPEAEQTLAQSIAEGVPGTLLVGPEAGLSSAETDAAISRGLTAVRLGPRVLRTETAALAALAALQALAGDL